MPDTNGEAGFAGTWELVESYSEKPSGRASFPLGDAVIGRINYDTAGNMAAQLMGLGREPLSSRDPRAVSDAEYREAFQTYTSYFGTYTVNAAEGTVVHHVVGASVPNWPGNDQLRYFEFTGDCLILRTPPMRGNDGEKAVHTLVWRRIA
jgi:hypothetical protein